LEDEYGSSYYESSCSLTGMTAYTRDEPEWALFFGNIAQHIVNDLRPRRVLDAGCAIGFLVEELRNRGVDAFGFDISSYAISQVPADLRPYVCVGSILDPDLLLNQHFDLVVCIEVVEHLQPHETDAAIANLCRWGDAVLFSSSPEDFTERTHHNVQRPGYWARKFADNGFALDANYDATYITPWAMLFRRGAPPSQEGVESLAEQLYASRQSAHPAVSPGTGEAVSLALSWQPTWREKQQVRWAQARRRWQLLHRTTQLTLREKGLAAVLRQSVRWVAGERGYWVEVSGGRHFQGTDVDPVKATEPYDPAEGEFLRYRFRNADYEAHVRLREPDDDALRAQAQAMREWPQRPQFSIVTPIYNPPLPVLQELVFSLRAQTYDRWEWIAADGSTDPAVWAALIDAAGKDSRIRPVRLETNAGISGNTNAALEHAAGEFVVLLDHDDTLASHALSEIAEVVRAQPTVDFIYSDEDKLDLHNRRCEPFFKPDWSPELLLSGNYLIHVAVFRRALLSQVGPFDPQTDGAQDWDMFLRISDVTTNFAHIPKVLYHWRKSDTSTAQTHLNKPYVLIAQQRSIQAHLQRMGLQNPATRFVPRHIIHSVTPVSEWELSRVRRVSIIIPTKNSAALLKTCMKGILERTDYPDFEVLLVDSGSTDAGTLTLYEQLRADARVRIIDYPQQEFNFAAACNLGAANATGEVLVFLNNDIEVLQQDWLQRMAQWLEIPQVGIVGAKLLFPNGDIQHAGIVLGLDGCAGHIFGSCSESVGSMFGTEEWYRNYLAVTGACLMIAKPVFDQLGGFDEAYRMDFSDVALCVRAHAAGWRTVYTPLVRMIHHESASRSLTRYRADYERAGQEFRPYLENGDPFFNPNYALTANYPALRIDEPSALELYRKKMAALPPGEKFNATDLMQPWAGGEAL
jgi:GT2 family glycosyltransferase/SAM-dependent methyltransferase